MKTIYTLAFFLFALAGIAQTAPKLINYQGVARNGLGVPIANKTIQLKFEIKDATNATLFTETQTVSSNALGIFNTQIGKGPGSNLDLNQWSNGPFSLTVGMDTANAGFTTFAAQQLASVPYALYSNSAGSVPSASLSFDNNTKILSIGQGTVLLPSSGTPPSPTLSVDGTGKLTVTPGGGSIFFSGTNAATVTPTTGSTGGYNIDVPKVTISSAISPGPIGGLPPAGEVIGLAQIFGTSPNFSVVVAPVINYDQNTGFLNLSNNTGLNTLYGTANTQPYNVGYNITPALTLTARNVRSGPSSNSIDLTPITPWNYNSTNGHITSIPPTAPTTTVAVGINTTSPGCALDVAGYTKLGGGTSGANIQVVKLTGTTNANQGLNTGIPLPTFVSQNKILSISVLVDASNNNSGDWIHPNYTYLGTGYQFNWRITTNSIFIKNVASNSFNILSRAVKVMITYEQ